MDGMECHINKMLVTPQNKCFSSYSMGYTHIQCERVTNIFAENPNTKPSD